MSHRPRHCRLTLRNLTTQTLFVALAACLLAGCGGTRVFRTESGEEFRQLTPEEYIAQLRADGGADGTPRHGGTVFGFNMPGQWSNGVGVRAVRQDRRVAISVVNRSTEPVTVGPKFFCLEDPERRYMFEPGRDDLSSFPLRTLAPGEGDVFVVGLGDPAAADGRQLAFAYPPLRAALRVPLETPTGTIELPPVRDEIIELR